MKMLDSCIMKCPKISEKKNEKEGISYAVVFANEMLNMAAS